MPWTAEDVERHNAGLSDKRKRQWVAVANSTLASCLKDGGEQKECEAKAVRIANGAAKKSMEEGEVHIVKVDQDQHLVFGFFSINKVGADLVEDHQGDLIETNELEKSAYDFVLNARMAGEEHVRKNVGTLVESIVFSYEKQTAIQKALNDLGIPAVINLGCEGWFGGFKVMDEKVWKSVKEGEYPAFSIGGRGQREEVK